MEYLQSVDSITKDVLNEYSISADDISSLSKNLVVSKKGRCIQQKISIINSILMFYYGMKIKSGPRVRNKVGNKYFEVSKFKLVKEDKTWE